MVGLLEQAKIATDEDDKEKKKQEAALLATDNPAFYSVKLFNLFSSWTNVAGSNRQELNDMTATLIGIVLYQQPFTEALTGSYLYTGKDVKPSYRPTDNKHYEELQKKLQKLNLKDLMKRKEVKEFEKIEDKVERIKKKLEAVRKEIEKELTETEQNTLHTPPLDNKAIAGILSSRAFAQAYYSAGTNRRATAFVLKYFLCHDMESLHDIKDVDDSKVRKDVSRSPGGDPQLFRKRCVGCHAGMDAMSGWNLYYDFENNGMVYNKNKPEFLTTCDRSCRDRLIAKGDLTRGNVNKVNFNDAMAGDVADVADDSFTNIWTTGQNAVLGWEDGTTSGNGANEWGQMITQSEAFATCMATHVYENVCMVTPTSVKEKNLRDTLAENFRKENHNMKKLFAMTAVGCLPGEK